MNSENILWFIQIVPKPNEIRLLVSVVQLGANRNREKKKGATCTVTRTVTIMYKTHPNERLKASQASSFYDNSGGGQSTAEGARAQSGVT